MDNREIVNNALEIACTLAGRKQTGELKTVWQIGLRNYSDGKIEEAAKCFCEYRDNTYMPTPAEFMSYLQYDDPNGRKKAQRSIEETQKYINP